VRRLVREGILAVVTGNDQNWHSKTESLLRKN
jgi:hypothetical protein